MISDIVITGFLDENIGDGFRKIKTIHNDYYRPEVDVISYIPTIFWSRMETSPLTRPANGTKIVLRGHIEQSDKIGLYVVAESIQLYK